MAKLNADKPHLWKADITTSVDFYNAWFMRFAPQTYRDKRVEVAQQVANAFLLTADLTGITADVLKAHPNLLPTLRMSCCPPIARERLAGLAGIGLPFVLSLESGKLPKRLGAAALTARLDALLDKLRQLYDADLIPWLAGLSPATPSERDRAASVIADRLCGAMSDPIIRNAQEERQLVAMRACLSANGYTEQTPNPQSAITLMPPGTFAARFNLFVGTNLTKLPVDVIVQPHRPRKGNLPVLFELKSAGDFTNVNKRRKEEAKKMSQLKAEFGSSVEYILLLCGYFNAGYLGYEAAEGIDWVWEHRLADLDALGLNP